MKETPSANKSPPKDDPRIDALIRGYAHLSEQVEVLTEQVKIQKHQVDDLTVDAILAEFHQKQERKTHADSPTPYGRTPPEPAEKEEAPKHLQPEKPHRKRQGLKLAGNIVFYSALVFLIISALFIRTTSNGSPRSLAGFTGMVVLSGSMQAEIPKGSLVIAQQVDPKTLQIGDDITFMANPTTTVTHRLIGSIEDYEDTGQRAFQTQGIMHDEPDAQPVPAVNVVGKVIFHSEVLGQIAGFMGQYWLFILFAAAVVIGLTVILKRIYQKEPKQTAH